MCNRYACAGADAQVDYGYCYQSNYDDAGYRQYYVQPCVSKVNTECPVSSPGTGGLTEQECEPPSSLPITVYPGEICDPLHKCVDGTSCVSGFCEGIAKEGVCSTSEQCAPGLICNGTLLRCEDQYTAASTATCRSDYDCSNNDFCSAGACKAYFSLGNKESCFASSHCKSAFCYPESNGYCYDAPASAGGFPETCSTEGAGSCVSKSWVDVSGNK